MEIFQTKFIRKAAAAAALAVCAVAGTSQAQTVLYSSRGANASTQSISSYAQQVTLAGGASSYSLSAMTFGVNIPDPNSGFDVFLDFYTGADLSPTSTSALANATFVQDEGFDIPAGSVGAAGSYNFTLTFAAPFVINNGTFTVVASLTEEDGDTYATSALANARFSLSAATVGTSPGFVWADANLDGVFAGSEQTKFGGTFANIRMDITATPVATLVPEPGTNVALGCGALGLLGVWQLRRRASRA